jgi:hypothetical protein
MLEEQDLGMARSAVEDCNSVSCFNFLSLDALAVPDVDKVALHATATACCRLALTGTLLPFSCADCSWLLWLQWCWRCLYWC